MLFQTKSRPTPALLNVSFSEAVQAAMSFVYAALHERLPQQVQQANIQKAYFTDLPLTRIGETVRPREHGTYSERCLDFYFGKEREWVQVYLRKDKHPGSVWRVISMGYDMTYNGPAIPEGFRDVRARYELVVEPYYIGETLVTTSGFRDLHY